MMIETTPERALAIYKKLLNKPVPEEDTAEFKHLVLGIMDVEKILTSSGMINYNGD